MSDKTENNTCCHILADALEDWAAKIEAQDEFDISKHDKRYHPHGYSDGDDCKYRDGSLDTPQEDTIYLSKSRGLDDIEVIKKVENTFCVRPIFPKNSDEMFNVYGIKKMDAMNLEVWGNPVRDESALKNIRAFYEVLCTIKERNPKFGLMNPLMFSWDVYEKMRWYGLSTLDKRDEDYSNYIILSDFDSKGRDTFPIYHSIRHEIGHSLATQDIANQWLKFRLSEFEINEKYEETISQKVSAYALKNDEEAIAEAFACYTAPTYIKGTMPKDAERIIENMLDINALKGVVMDEDIFAKKREGVPKLNPAYMHSVDTFKMDPKDVLRWFDFAKGKYIAFDTNEEKFRYILSCYGVSQEWINAYCKQFNNKKWTENDAWHVMTYYRNTCISLDNALERDKKWFGEEKKGGGK